MKEAHRAFLASEGWAEMLRSDLLPWLTAGGDLGDDVLEIGPGPGRTTDLLRERVAKVTALELDRGLASALSARLGDSNVEVIHGDGTNTRLPSDRFSAVTCFHVLHHVPTAALQDRVFGEVCRVLRPGGLFLVADALDLAPTRQRHEEEQETFLPLDPADLRPRLQLAGFSAVTVESGDYQLLFRARKRA
jgi:SAM-dependent methyltransferase